MVLLFWFDWAYSIKADKSNKSNRKNKKIKQNNPKIKTNNVNWINTSENGWCIWAKECSMVTGCAFGASATFSPATHIIPAKSDGHIEYFCCLVFGESMWTKNETKTNTEYIERDLLQRYSLWATFSMAWTMQLFLLQPKWDSFLFYILQNIVSYMLFSRRQSKWTTLNIYSVHRWCDDWWQLICRAHTTDTQTWNWVIFRKQSRLHAMYLYILF